MGNHPLRWRHGDTEGRRGGDDCGSISVIRVAPVVRSPRALNSDTEFATWLTNAAAAFLPGRFARCILP